MPPKKGGKKRRSDGSGGGPAKVAKSAGKGKGKGKGKAAAADSDDEEQEPPASQSKGKSKQDPKEKHKAMLAELGADKKKKIAAMVRAIIFRSTTKKQMVMQHFQEVMGTQKSATAAVLEEARKTLRNVFGMDLVELPKIRKKEDAALPLYEVPAEEERGTRQYVLMNVLDEATQVYAGEDGTEQFAIDWSAHAPKLGLTMTVLLLIYSSNGEIQHKDLWHSLGRLGIKKNVGSQKKEHPEFGDAQTFIEKDLVSQKYLSAIKRSERENATADYRWGPRALAEFTEKTILSFAADVYGEDVNQWLEKLGEKRGTAEESGEED